MGSRNKREISTDSIPDPSFDEQFSLWLDLIVQLDAPYPSNVDAFVYEAAMDVVYDRKKPIETWLSHHCPSSAFEAFCLVEIARREDEDMSECVARALRNTQGWLAQRLLLDFQESPTPAGKRLMDRTIRLTLPIPAAA